MYGEGAILVIKYARKRALVRHVNRWEDNITVVITEIHELDCIGSGSRSVTVFGNTGNDSITTELVR